MLKWLSFLTSATALVVITLAGLTVSVPAHASALIDPNFTVCGSSALTTQSTCGVHPNPINGAGTLYAGVTGSGGSGPLNPFLLLVAVPDAPGPLSAVLPVFTGTGSVSPGSGSLTISAATTAEYGQSNSPTSGLLAGPFTSGDVYSFAGLSGGNSSFSFANMTGTGTQQNGSAEQNILGVVPTSFRVYEFVVNVSGASSNLSTGNIYNIPYSSIPLGSYVAAYGIECYPDNTGVCAHSNSNHVYDSSFTVSGWVDGSPPLPPGSLPEPGTLALLGISLAALGLSRHRWMERLGSARVA